MTWVWRVAIMALLLIFGGLCFTLGNYWTILYNGDLTPQRLSAINNENANCSDKGLVDTAKCLNKQLSGFYHYNISNVNKDLTEDELKEYGGVCRHYAEWYIIKAQALGFYAKGIIFNVGFATHEIALISNDEGYCTLDQTTANCVKLDLSVLNKTEEKI